MPAPSAALPQLASEPKAASVSVPAAPPQVKLTVEIEPENARVLVDGAFLPSNSEIAKFAKDDGMHKVRAEAPGFRPKSEWVRFDSDNVTVRMSLEPAHKGRKDGGAPSQSGTTQETETRRRSPAPPPIDTADPWTR